MSGDSFLRINSFRSQVRRVPILLNLVLVSLAGCGGDVVAPTDANDTGGTVGLPGGTTLAIPTGAQYFYMHIPIGSASQLQLIPNDFLHNELVIARIDWSVCNPAALQIKFVNLFISPFNHLTWRMPTRIVTPSAGINILGIFSSGATNTLEGGLRMDLDATLNDFREISRVQVVDGCSGDWVTLYGYTK